VSDFDTKPNAHFRSNSLRPVSAKRSASLAQRILSLALSSLECNQGRSRATANLKENHHATPLALSLNGSSCQLPQQRKHSQIIGEITDMLHGDVTEDITHTNSNIIEENESSLWSFHKKLMNQN